MTKIITTSQVQKKIGDVSKNIGKHAYIATKRGEGSIVMLPYFDGCDEWISEYMEDYEMYQNKEKLEKRWVESSASGDSDLII